MTKKVKDVVTPEVQDEMDVFMTKKYHGVAQKLMLYSPDGRATDHYLELVGMDSEKVRKAKKQLYTDIAKNVKEGGFDDDMQYDFTTRLLASSIVGWSFKKELSDESAFDFVSNAPSIRDAIDVFISNNDNFFKKK